jgi:hypothetical protein
MSARTKLHFNRYEMKYILPEALRRELESEFQYFVELDPFVAGRPGAKYFVRSLYFDNEAFDHYFEKIDGLKHRNKFRVRTYTSDPEADVPRFLELKGRHNNLVLKRRTRIQPVGFDPRAFGERFSDQVLEHADPGPIRDRFRFDRFRRRVEPVMLIDYWRRAYVSKYDPGFRMTFDDNLYGTACDRLFPDPRFARKSLLAGRSILEVKFEHHIPRWFHSLIQTLELNRVSISKYCAGIEQHALAPVLE